MEQFKRAKVVMLPTNEKALLSKDSYKRLYFGNYPSNTPLNQHLYIISDDNIEVGDWVILKVSDRRPLYCVKVTSINSVDKTATVLFPSDKSTIEVFISGCKKIIATNDTNITSDYSTPGTTFVAEPSEAFIIKFVEEYNKGNIITDVLVEYEKSVNPCSYCVSVNGGVESPDCCGNYLKEIVKINPKNNTITIKKVKDSWNKEELQLFKGSTGNHIEWIYQRLINKHGENPNYDYMLKLKELSKFVEENL